jgi:predicted transcriptional regulator of viral defense system
VIRLTEPSLSEGIEKQSVEGVTVRVYSAAKTVADCFKFRNKIGLDIAIEALKDCLRQKKATVMSAGAKIDHRTPRERCFAAE